MVMGRLDPVSSPGSGNRIFANELSEAIRKNKYMLVERQSMDALILQYGTQAARVGVPALPTAAADGLNAIHLPHAFGYRAIEMHQVTAQTLMPLLHATKGLEIGLDKVDNESVEYVPGGNSAANPLGYTAGVDPGVYIRATFEFADTSGSDQFIVGFRKQENYVTPTSFLSAGDALYTDFAGLGFSGTAAANLVKSMSDLNNAGSTVVTSSAFPWADAGIHQLEVRVSGRVTSYFINGVRTGDTVTKDALGTAITAAPTVALPAFTFDSGDFLIPFIFHRFDATSPGAVYLRRLEVGQLSEVGLQRGSRNAYA
jgi:hypothetical protein